MAVRIIERQLRVGSSVELCKRGWKEMALYLN
jgi:hypothetical protein